MSQFESLPELTGQSWEGRTIYYYICKLCNMKFSVPFGGNHEEILKRGHSTAECNNAVAEQIHES